MRCVMCRVVEFAPSQTDGGVVEVAQLYKAAEVRG